MLKRQLCELIEILNEAYIARDVSRVDYYMDRLFAPGADTVIGGTSNGELCLGFEACKNLLASDWSDWGVVRSDVDTAKFDIRDDMAWFSVAATVDYKFVHDEATAQRFVDFVGEELKTAELGPAEGLSLINWVLTHFTFMRESGERMNYMPMLLTGAIARIDEQWKFKYMQFSVPPATYPDQHFGTPALENLHRLCSFNLGDFPQSQQRDSLRQEVELFLTDYNHGQSISLDESLNQALTKFRQSYGEMHIDMDNAIYVSHSSWHWFVASGYTRHIVPDEVAFRQRIREVADYLNANLSAQEKLFRIQRDIAATLREVASGSERKYICRLEVALVQDESGYHITHAYPSFPFYWALEGKLDS